MVLASLLAPGLPAGAQAPNQPVSTSKVSVMTIDDQFAEVGRRVPAFGGVFVDDDTLYVYLTDASPSASPVIAATQTLRDVIGPQLVARIKVQALPATYSFVQLKAWFDRMTD